MTGGAETFGGGHKNFNAPNSRLWTKKQSFSSRISTNFGVKTKKINISIKGLQLKKYTNFHDFWGGTTKKMVFIPKSAKKQFLLKNSGMTTSILRVPGLELYSIGTEPVTFFGAQSSLGGAQFSFGGTAPECFPRGARPDEVLFWSSPIDEN